MHGVNQCPAHASPPVVRVDVDAVQLAFILGIGNVADGTHRREANDGPMAARSSALRPSRYATGMSPRYAACQARMCTRPIAGASAGRAGRARIMQSIMQSSKLVTQWLCSESWWLRPGCVGLIQAQRETRERGPAVPGYYANREHGCRSRPRRWSITA